MRNNYLKSFRKHFGIDSKVDLQQVAVAVEAVCAAQMIGQDYLGDIDPMNNDVGFRVHCFVNILSRIFEHSQAMLVAIATKSFTSAEALARIVVEGSINLMYLAARGNSGMLANYLQSWVREHNKKLEDWKKRAADKPYAANVSAMIESRQGLMVSYQSYISQLISQCNIDNKSPVSEWPSNLFQRFSGLEREVDYYTSYHRLSGSSHLTGEDTLSWLLSLNFSDEQKRRLGAEACAYSVMMTRVAANFFVDAVAACVIAYGRADNSDLLGLKVKLSDAVSDIAEAAGCPKF